MALSDRVCRHGRQIGKCADCDLDHMEMAADAEARRVDELTAQPVARESLTDEQIDRAIAELGLNYLADAHATNRAVLRKLCHHAHGIKGGQHG